MKQKILNHFITIISITLASTNIFADAYEPISHLKDIAKTFVIKNIAIEQDESIDVLVNQSNSPIQVPKCGKIIEANLPQNHNKEQITSIELDCTEPTKWHVMIPVEVKILSNVIVAKRNISMNEPIQAEDIDFTVANKNRLYSGYFKRKEDVIGKESTHIISSGTILTPKNIRLPILIHRNQAINIISKNKSVTVTVQGIAKSDGALNEMIKVLNPSSKKTFDATVIGPGKAEVALS